MAYKIENLSFGFFDDLSDEEQSQVHSILSKSQPEKSGEKKPEFAWLAVEQAKGQLVEDVEENIQEEEDVQEQVITVKTERAEGGKEEFTGGVLPLPIDVSIPPPPIPHTMRPPFQDPIHGVPTMPPQYAMPMFPPGVYPPHGMPMGFQYVPMMPYQTAAVPNIAFQGFPMQYEQPCVRPTLPDAVQNIDKPQVDYDQQNRNEMDSTQKPRERRNKKRRPPDYYQRLEQPRVPPTHPQGAEPVQMDNTEFSQNYINQPNEVLTNSETDNHGQNFTSTASFHIDTNDQQRIETLRTDVHIDSKNYSNESCANDRISGKISENETFVAVRNDDAIFQEVQNVDLEAKNIVNQAAQLEKLTNSTIASKNKSVVVSMDKNDNINPSSLSKPSTEIAFIERTQQDNCDKFQNSIMRESQQVKPRVAPVVSDKPLRSDAVVTSTSSNLGSNIVTSTVSSSAKTHVDVQQSTDKTSHPNLHKQSSNVTPQSQTTNTPVTNTTVKHKTPAQTETKTAPPPTVPTGPAPVQPAPVKSSWAGLFSANKGGAVRMLAPMPPAPVVVQNSPQQVNGDSPSTKESKVCQASEDSAARQLGDILSSLRYNGKIVSVLLRGLNNCGNWCYINATLQALLACPQFYHLMKSLPAFPALQRGPTSTPVIDSMVEFINQFQVMPPQKLKQEPLNAKGTVKQDIPTGKPFEPTFIYNMLKKLDYTGAFKHGRQEDAEEFLSCVLDKLHEEMVSAIKIVKGETPPPEELKNGDTEEESTENEQDDDWEQVGPKNKIVVTRSANYTRSPLSDIFRGQMRSILHQQGARESATVEPFFTLQLDIQADSVRTVEDALRGLAIKEALQGYTSSKTKQEVEASRRLALELLPSVLVLHLKCFVYDKDGGCQKMPKRIEFQENLEISKDILSQNARSKYPPNQRRYKLFAVVNHHGSKAVGGHYTTYVFHHGVAGWVHIDDTLARPVSFAQVTKYLPPKVPYLLYYRRVATP